MRRSPIVDTTAGLIFHSAIVVSMYLLFAGHDQPGGGFVGGLVAGAGVAVHYVAGGIDAVRSLSRLRPWTVLGGGLGLASVVALVPLVVGGDVMESGVLELDLPGLGRVEVVSSLPFDVGVYAVVVGLVLMVFEAVGDERQPEDLA